MSERPVVFRDQALEQTTVVVNFGTPPAAAPIESPVTRKALWVLAMYIYEDTRRQLGNPENVPWVELGYEYRKAQIEWTRNYIERQVRYDEETFEAAFPGVCPW